MAKVRNVDVTIESQGEPWDHVRVWKLQGREAIGELFAFDLDVACDHGHELPEGTAPGEEVTLVFAIDGEELRRVHGVLGPIRKQFAGPDDHAPFRLRVVPRASRLALVETQEIFLDRTVPEILQSKLERHDLAAGDVELRLLGTYPKREFVTQYRESDLAFVSRLCEQAGISFFFEHDDGRDRMVLTDHEGGFRARDGEIHFFARGETSGVFALERVEAALPTSYIEQDYNYRTPLVELTGVFDLEAGNGGGVVEYGAHVKTPEEAQRLAKMRAEERRAQQLYYEGKSGAVSLAAGQRIALTELPGADGPESLLLVELSTDLTIPLFDALSERASEAHYVNTLRAVPTGFTYRPKRSTPKPVLAGVVTGIIQPGSEGETGGIAQIDSEGRYLVQLHFDTAQPGQAKASHRIRMAQPFAGPSYGMHLPLRRGTEVLVAFTNGDPDRPVIVGAVYNATSPNPVVASNAGTHQIKTSHGITLEMGGSS